MRKILKLIDKTHEPVSHERKQETTEITAGYSDLTYLKQIAEGNTEFILEMITSFIADLPKTLSDMDKALSQKKWPELKVIAHTLKSSADFIGMHNIKETLKNIEKYAADRTNLELLPELVAKTKNHCMKAMEEVKSEIKKNI